jgi:hypothetical protein
MRTDEARDALVKGVKIIDTKMPRLDSGDLGGDWGDLIIAHALEKEAKELIEGQSAAGQK